MNLIQSFIGPNRCVILSTTQAFGLYHTSSVFTSITMKKNGVPWPSGSSMYVRYTDTSGVLKECDWYTYPTRTQVQSGYDCLDITPYRSYSPEAIEPVATVVATSNVIVTSLRTGITAQYTVTAVNNDKTITVNFPAAVGAPGDSNSLVTTLDGIFVGFVSARSGSSAIVSVPTLGIPSTPIPPLQLPPPPQGGDVYAAGIAAGRAQIKATLITYINGL